MLLDNVVFTRGAAAHLPDKPLIAFYDTHKGKGVMVFYSAAITRPLRVERNLSATLLLNKNQPCLFSCPSRDVVSRLNGSRGCTWCITVYCQDYLFILHTFSLFALMGYQENGVPHGVFS